MVFAAELAKYGPGSNAARPSLADAQAYTTALARGHYENFPVLSWFVPPALRQHFANVYAYCRWSDDLADEVRDPRRSLELLDWWESELDGCYGGGHLPYPPLVKGGSIPTHPVMVALQATIEQFGIPRQPFVDLLTAFRRDQRQSRYATFDELRDYCRCSADPVGRLVLYLCARFSDENAVLSDRICTGLQLANFWQDVSVDLQKGRIYLPTEDLARFGVSEAELLSGDCAPAFVELMRFEVDRAEAWLRQGLPLVGRMPGRLKIVIAMFAQGGLSILQKVRDIDYNVVTQRPKLKKSDFARIMAKTAFGTLFGGLQPRSGQVTPSPAVKDGL